MLSSLRLSIGKHGLTTFDHPDFAALRLSHPVRVDRWRAFAEHGGRSFVVPLVLRASGVGGRPNAPLDRPHARFHDLASGDHRLMEVLADPARRGRLLAVRFHTRGREWHLGLFSVSPSGEEQLVGRADVERGQDDEAWLHSLRVVPYTMRRLRSQNPVVSREGPDSHAGLVRSLEAQGAPHAGLHRPPRSARVYQRQGLGTLLSNVVDEVCAREGVGHLYSRLLSGTTGKPANVKRHGWTALSRYEGSVVVHKDLGALRRRNGW